MNGKPNERVVRVIIEDDHKFPYGFLDSMRRAGYFELNTESSYDMLCPKGLDNESWAEQTAKRMQSFGFNAVSAPRCK